MPHSSSYKDCCKLLDTKILSMQDRMYAASDFAEMTSISHCAGSAGLKMKDWDKMGEQEEALDEGLSGSEGDEAVDW